MSEFNFTETERPAVTRETAPNPFADAVKSLLDADGKPTDKALSFSVKADSDKAKNLNTISRQIRECGKPLNVTVRQKRTYDEKKKTATFTFWTVDRITHSDANGGQQ